MVKVDGPRNLSKENFLEIFGSEFSNLKQSLRETFQKSLHIGKRRENIIIYIIYRPIWWAAHARAILRPFFLFRIEGRLFSVAAPLALLCEKGG